MMGLDGGMHSLGLTLQVFILDILLSGDNAIVIAMACRRLPPQKMRQALMIGTGAAIGLRIFFTAMVTFLLNVPCLKLLGMFALIAIAIKLLVEEPSDLDDAGSVAGNGQFEISATRPSTPISLWSTIGIIVVADVAMSLDNVVALAAVAQNSIYFLMLGLALSVPLLMYGSLFMTALLKRYPFLIPAGGALLGWVAGDIGMSDPLIADWVTAEASGLTLVMPLVCAIFVLLESRIIQKNMQLFPQVRPIFRPAPVRTLPERPAPESITVAIVEAPPVMTPIDTQSAGDARNGMFITFFTRLGSLYIFISVIVLFALGVISFIAYNGVKNRGFMPPPTPLMRYECPGSNGAFSFYYRHGKNSVLIRTNSGALAGRVNYGKINWFNASEDTALLGFTPPQEITYEDAKSIRINGGSFSQVDCANMDRSSTPP